jgi:hypothetical protein
VGLHDPRSGRQPVVVVVGRIPAAAPHEKFTVDIHCVTKWTKLDMTWSGVSLDTFLEAACRRRQVMPWRSPTAATPQTSRWQTLRNGKAWFVDEYDGRPLDPEHGGPARLLVPHLYFWKSAKVDPWIGPAAHRSVRRFGRCSAITTMETRGKSNATTATDVADRHGDRDDRETPRVKTIALRRA